MNYAINLNRITMADYKEHLLSIELLPSRRVLLDSIDQRFSAITASGLNDIGAFLQAVSTPKKLSDLSQKTFVGEDYLKILKREIGSLVPKNVALAEFDMLTPNTVETLKSAGLRTSKDYYEAYPDIDGSEIRNNDSERLYRLCDLVRINGIGALAAKMFLEAGYASVADIASGNPEEMVKKVNTLNADKHDYDGQPLGLKDMTFCIVHAKMLMKYS